MFGNCFIHQPTPLQMLLDPLRISCIHGNTEISYDSGSSINRGSIGVEEGCIFLKENVRPRPHFGRSETLKCVSSTGFRISKEDTNPIRWGRIPTFSKNGM